LKIDSQKCVGCKICLPYCPVEAIKEFNGKCYIDEDACVECYVCYRSKVCPNNAFQEVPLKWPRTIRHTFSAVQEEHATGIPGRGTEEVKTNDVTGRYGFGEVGFTVDLGRPGVGTSLREVEKITKAVAKVGVEFEPRNPITMFMVNKEQGTLSEQIINEMVLSCIIEFKIAESKFLEVVNALETVSKQINTVFTVGCITRVRPNGDIPLKNLMDQAGIFYRPNGKINLGLASKTV